MLVSTTRFETDLLNQVVTLTREGILSPSEARVLLGIDEPKPDSPRTLAVVGQSPTMDGYLLEDWEGHRFILSREVLLARMEPEKRR